MEVYISCRPSGWLRKRFAAEVFHTDWLNKGIWSEQGCHLLERPAVDAAVYPPQASACTYVIFGFRIYNTQVDAFGTDTTGALPANEGDSENHADSVTNCRKGVVMGARATRMHDCRARSYNVRPHQRRLGRRCLTCCSALVDHGRAS